MESSCNSQHAREFHHTEDAEGGGIVRRCVLSQETVILKDEMTLKSRGPLPLYYEFLYGI